MRKSAAEGSTPEIRFRPPPELYAKAARIAEGLGIKVTEVARMGLAKIANAGEIRLEPPQPAQSLRDFPIHGVTIDETASVAATAARAADRSHVQAGRLKPVVPSSVKR